MVHIDDSSCVLGEQEAIWLLRLFLPYVNELLLKLRALFSGDPATTMRVIFFSSPFFTFSMYINEAKRTFFFFFFLISEYKKMTNSEIYDNGSWQYCSLFWLGAAAA